MLRNIKLDIAEGEFHLDHRAVRLRQDQPAECARHDGPRLERRIRLRRPRGAGHERETAPGLRARQGPGFIFQHYHLIDDLTVAENLDLPLQYRDVPTRERTARVTDALDRFQIVGKKDLYPNQLSGGQQQLVAVARAVIARPRLLLADEPTGALHSSQGQMIMDLLRQLNGEGTAIVQVTHNEAYAKMAKRVVSLFDGWLTEV